MAEFDVIPSAAAQAQEFIKQNSGIPKLLNDDFVAVEPAAESLTSTMTAFFLTADTHLLLVALCTCIAVFTLVLGVFVRYRERVRRYVTGENRRVGSVYYVRPGMAATQPTEI